VATGGSGSYIINYKNMKKCKPQVGDWFILKTSYCNKHGCCDSDPCPECLEMCNRYVISAHHCNKDFFFGGGWCSRNGGCQMDSTYSAVLTTDKSIVDGIHGIHHISEAIFIDPPNNLESDLDRLTRSTIRASVYLAEQVDDLRDRISRLEELTGRIYD
jgi:hypothetical protein